jgi:hypothetical protein
MAARSISPSTPIHRILIEWDEWDGEMKQSQIVIGSIILCAVYGLLLTLWFRSLLAHLNRAHKAACERLEPSLFERRRVWRIGIMGTLWTWAGLRFFLLKKYDALQDSGFQHRARRFRFALGTYLLMVIIVVTIALYLNPH